MSRYLVEFNEQNEFCLPSFWDNPLKDLSPEIINEIDRQIPNLPHALAEYNNPTHNRFHITEGINILNTVAPFLELNAPEMKQADLTLRLHDVGYIAHHYGIINHDQHHLAGAYMASKLTKDKGVICAVAHHNENVMPFDSPRFARIVKGIDVILLQGYVGVTRRVLYNLSDPVKVNL